MRPSETRQNKTVLSADFLIDYFTKIKVMLVEVEAQTFIKEMQLSKRKLW